jgi:ABC-2 type transport system permease protein
MWALRIALARFRPVGAALGVKVTVIVGLFALFLALDYAVFRRLFRAASKIEELTPFFAIGLVTNFLSLVFLVALFVLFFSALTSSIGALFTDFDLEIYHAAPRARTRVALERWTKTLVQSSYVVFAFLVPMFFAFAAQYRLGFSFVALVTMNLLLLLVLPVSLACLVILLLVRYFPVRRVHQIAATLAIMFVTLVVTGIRVARPERLFTEVRTDDVVAVLQAIELPSADRYPSSWLAQLMAASVEGAGILQPQLRLAAVAAISLAAFLLVAHRLYFRAFVRSRETSAPTVIGSGQLTRLLDRLTRRLDPQVRAVFGKELRLITRDAAQWSQLFMLIALLFIYLYNIQMMPLQGDARAAVLAYLNLGMSGFVIAAICLRFAYPSVSAEGKQFWILQSAPLSYRKLLWMKTVVYLLPLLLVGLLLVALANLILEASPQIWAYTLTGSLLVTATLVSLGVAMGALAPDFKVENPIEVSLSLGGLAYLALSMLYVGMIMFLMARPVQRFLLRILFGFHEEQPLLARAAPVAIAAFLSLVLTFLPMEIASRRLAAREQY